MSNEEAMFEIGRYYEEGIRPSEESIKHIINVLQNTDDDCISRHEVLNIVNFEDKWLLDAKGHNADTEIIFSGMKSRIADLPSVNPQKSKFVVKSDGTIEQIKNCNDCLLRKEWEKIGKMLSATLEKQTEQEHILDKIDEIITDALDKSTDQKESQTLRWVLDKISEVAE